MHGPDRSPDRGRRNGEIGGVPVEIETYVVPESPPPPLLGPLAVARTPKEPVMFV
jgi:hypothetical protein